MRHAPRAARGARVCDPAPPPRAGIILITHYQRLLDYIKPDFVHVMSKGQIVRSGGPELALELEKDGYAFLDEKE